MILVTGSNSFVGHVLIRKIREQGLPVTGWDLNPGPTTDRVLDIGSPALDAAFPENADVLIHLAAVSRDPDCIANPSRAFEVNVGATLNLVRVAQQKRLKHIVFASTEWVYGPAAAKGVQTETSPIDITTLSSEYPLTKIVGERCLAAAQGRGLCPVTVLRFGIIYGPREANWSSVEQVFFGVRDRNEVSVRGSLQTGRHFVHVSDIADGILLAAKAPPQAFEVYNLAGPTLVRLSDIAAASAKVLGKTPAISEGDPSAVSVRLLSSAKIQERLGWKPKISLEDGLRSLIGGAS